MRNNKGYTLIEMLIVIAIIAILSGVSFITVGVINEARCNAAVNTFENQLSSLVIKTKALSQGKIQASPLTSELESTYPLSMLIRKNTDASDDVQDGSYEIILGYYDGITFQEKEVVTTMTRLIDIKYTSTETSQEHGTLNQVDDEGNVESVLLQFNKSDGSVKYGAGTYKFEYNNKSYGTVKLDQVTGSHHIK